MRRLVLLLLTLGSIAEAKPLIITGDVPASSPVYEYLDRLEAYGCALPTFRAMRPLPYGNLFHAIPGQKVQTDENGEQSQAAPADACAAPKWLLKMRELIRRG